MGFLTGFINNVPLPIQIFGKLTKQLFLMIAIVLLAETGLTNHIERLNNTFRRVSRLVREAYHSQKLNNHIGAIWYFIHGYNAELERI